MRQYSALLLFAILLAGCTSQPVANQNAQDSNRGYFADASQCSQSAMRKESFNVPTAGSVSSVEIPVGYDAGKFTLCMEYAKRPVSRADASEYFKVSSACLQEARGADHADDSYADCVKRSRLDVEIINDR